MPDLSLEGVHKFWKDYQDPTVYRVISFMESVEKWTIDDHPEIKQALQELGNQLDGLTTFDLSREDCYIKVGCHLRTGTILRILQAIDTVSPGSASKVLMYAEENSQNNDEAASLFIRRNIVFERLRLLSRVFAPERLDLVARALEQGYDD